MTRMTPSISLVLLPSALVLTSGAARPADNKDGPDSGGTPSQASPATSRRPLWVSPGGGGSRPVSVSSARGGFGASAQAAGA